MNPEKEKLEDIIWLDLDKVEIYGFEDFKDVYNIAQMVRNIESGAEFPPVYVAKINDTKYVLSGYRNLDKDGRLIYDNYGGHHRALAHWIAGKPLKCVITENHWKGVYTCDLNIKDIVLRDYK